MGNITINKVKYNDKQGKIMIDFSRNDGDHTSEYTGVFDEQAAPEFYQALNALINPVINLFKFKYEDFKDRIEPYGVTFKFSNDDVMSAIISCKLTVGDTKIAINTPRRSCCVDDIEDDDLSDAYFDQPTVDTLWKLETECRKYLDGNRAQMSLFGADGSESVQADPEDEPIDVVDTDDFMDEIPDNIAQFPHRDAQ